MGRKSSFVFGAAWVIVCSLARSAETPAEPPHADSNVLGDGTLESLEVFPAKVDVVGPDRTARCVVTGVFSNGGVWDVSRKATFEIADPEVAAVSADGLLTPKKDGATEIRVSLTAGKTVEARVPVTVSRLSDDFPINFTNDVVPVFSKNGCNSGMCHGKSGGQNGFQMSLFGYVPAVDYDSIVRASRGRRVFPPAPEHSLLLRKPTGALPHGGGARFDVGSSDYKLLHRWIRSGLPFGKPDDPSIASIEVYPRARTLSRKGKQQLRVLARYTDGREEDVSERAQYSTGDANYLEVTSSGLVSALNVPGQATIMVRYLGRVAVFRALMPSGADISKMPKPPASGFIDELVFKRLDVLGLPPSELCTDAEFIRRATLDVCGTLPSSAEAAAFLADSDPRKREKLADRLLERPEYASYSALLWADLLRNRRGGEERAAPITIGFHRWIQDSFAENKPFDRFVREIICAEGSPSDNPPVAWYRSLESPKQLVDDVAQVFLGTRMQCARCHHHPFEKWAQDDYWKFATFFSRVQRKNDSSSRTFTVSMRRGDSRYTDDEPTSASFKKTYVGLKYPGGDAAEETSDDDPREALVDWMTAPGNSLFARAVVNRYWKRLLGRGIVEPEDDFRESNPPSNPELLDALARDFREHGYDLKRLVKLIVTSSTYQLSTVPNEHNRLDRQNFSRRLPDRLPAEVLLDAIDQVTLRKTRFQNAPRGARAIDLDDETSRNYFLETFGKPDRQSACACERSGDITLPQVIHLLNSRELQDKLSNDEGRAALLAKDPRPLAERVDELFLAAFSRHATGEEQKSAEAHFASAAGGKDGKNGAKEAPGASRKAWEDLIWALLNSKELFFKK